MEDVKPSKSELKRRYAALQELGEQLISLPSSQLDTLPLGDDLRAAIEQAARIKSHSALRRQRQLIGKLQDDAIARASAIFQERFQLPQQRIQILCALRLLQPGGESQ